MVELFDKVPFDLHAFDKRILQSHPAAVIIKRNPDVTGAEGLLFRERNPSESKYRNNYCHHLPSYPDYKYYFVVRIASAWNA